MDRFAEVIEPQRVAVRVSRETDTQSRQIRNTTQRLCETSDISARGQILGAWKRANDVGARIAELRRILGVDQAAFGELAGVTYQTVSDWENEHSKPPKSRLRILAQGVGVALSVFEEGGPRPKDLLPARGAEEGGAGRTEAVSEPWTPPYVTSIEATRAAAGDDASRTAAEIMLRRLVGRATIPTAEVMSYLAAVADAAAGRPVKLPAAPETPARELPPPQTGRA